MPICALCKKPFERSKPHATRQKYCRPCAHEKERVRRIEAKRQYKEYKRMGIIRAPEPKTTEKKTIMTDAQQARIDRECLHRDVERCGLTLDPGRSLSKKEIAAIKDQITPLNKIRKHSLCIVKVNY